MALNQTPGPDNSSAGDACTLVPLRADGRDGEERTVLALDGAYLAGDGQRDGGPDAPKARSWRQLPAQEDITTDRRMAGIIPGPTDGEVPGRPLDAKVG
jgi:hypothetical protein